MVYNVRNVGLEASQATARFWMDQHYPCMSKYHLRILHGICGCHCRVVEGSCLQDVAPYSCGRRGGRQCPPLARLLAPHSTVRLDVVYSYTKTLPRVLHFHPHWLACTLLFLHPHNPPCFCQVIPFAPRSELSYLAPLGSEKISAPYFKQCFFWGGGVYYPPG